MDALNTKIMKKLNYISSALLVLLLMGACEQELIVTTPPDPDMTNTGRVIALWRLLLELQHFTKFIAIGNSYVAGVQAGALFTDGQNSSLLSSSNKQLACAGGTATFKSARHQ